LIISWIFLNSYSLIFFTVYLFLLDQKFIVLLFLHSIFISTWSKIHCPFISSQYLYFYLIKNSLSFYWPLNATLAYCVLVIVSTFVWELLRFTINIICWFSCLLWRVVYEYSPFVCSISFYSFIIIFYEILSNFDSSGIHTILITMLFLLISLFTRIIYWLTFSNVTLYNVTDFR